MSTEPVHDDDEGSDHEVAHAGHGDHAEGGPTPAMDRAFWDERYRTSEALWSGEPNPQLVREAADLAPGTALDVGCGEGADAIWLAMCGWQVTAVDISGVALERGAAHARAGGENVAQRISWVRADVTEWTPEPAGFDLVSAAFLHLPPEPRERLHRHLAASVSAGGSLLLVGHHPSDLGTIPRPPRPELFFTAADEAASLDPKQWDIAVSEARPRPAVHPDGRTVTIHDAVLRAVRR